MIFPDDDFLVANVDAKAAPYVRLTCDYVDRSSRFSDSTQVHYAKQFAPIYATRLDQMRGLLTQKCIDKWGSKYSIKKMFELDEDHPQQCIIIGTIFKHQTLKPSILKELSEETQLAPQPPRFQFSADDDLLILEDELQRIRLVGDQLDVHQLVTGIVCAVLGYEHCDGKFHVEDYLFYESGPQAPLAALSGPSPLVVLISGLDQSASDSNDRLPLELLQQWLYGNLSCSADSTNDPEAASIVRCIVAGNSVRSSAEVRCRSNQLRQPESAGTLRAVCAVDEIIANWIRSVPVDLMAGEFDPTNYMLPQQPMHQCMFPKCAASANFRGVTNPYDCTLAGRRIVGTAGQNIEDVMRYSRITEPLEALRSCLRWSHMAPTCPDTLPCFPYAGQDPFVLSECPQVFFAGNAPAFATAEQVGTDGQRTRLVCVPRFATTSSVAVVNLRTLECKELRFSVGALEE